jgi:hypothetical protein
MAKTGDTTVSLPVRANDMTLRDWFAAAAMQALVGLDGLLLGVHDDMLPHEHRRDGRVYRGAFVANQAYYIADLMLDERDGHHDTDGNGMDPGEQI